MSRPRKEGVDYFSHDVDAANSRTIFTLESKFGNDGYAFWFKLLEILGSQRGLFYDCRNESNWLFLLAKTRVSEITAKEILNTLAHLGAIDADLMQNDVVWCSRFSERLSDVFKKRGAEIPAKPRFCDGNLTQTDISVSESTQSKVKESKVNKSKINTPIVPTGTSDALFQTFWKAYPRKVGKVAAEKAFAKLRVDDCLLDTILKAIESQKQSPQWQRDDGQYIPHPTTWLNQHRFEDEMEQAVTEDDYTPPYLQNYL